MPISSHKTKFNFASLLLCACMFASGACGIILEYIQASLASMILGNSFEQWAMVIGLMMFWMGFGSLIQAQIPKKYLIIAFISVETGLALAGGFSPTLTYISYGYTAHYSLALYFFVSFIGIMIGLEIPVIIRINNDFSKELSTNLGNILSADYLGSLIGSLIYVFILLRFVPITEAAFLTAGVNFSLAFITYLYFSKKQLIKQGFIIPVVMTMTCAAISYGYLQNREWNIKIEQPMVHPIMNLVPVKSKVLILGGGDGCALREVLKYKDVKEVLLVDLDPEMTKLAATHPLLTAINQNSFKDARLTTLTEKGINPGIKKNLYMEKATRKRTPNQTQPTQKIAQVSVMNVDADKFLSQIQGFWDVIIVDMPDPSTPELTKLYTTQFYKKIKLHLSMHGMIVVQSTSPYLAKESFLCIGRTIESAQLNTLPFHENVPSFGDWGWYLAWHPEISTEKIMQKIEDISIPVPTRFITEDVFKRELVFGKQELETTDKQVNTLLNPILLSIYNHESWLLE